MKKKILGNAVKDVFESVSYYYHKVYKLKGKELN